MIRFTVTASNGKHVYLNPAYVVAVRPAHSPVVPPSSVIHMTDDTTWPVVGAAVDVVDRIEKAL